MDERERLLELLARKYNHFCDQCGINKQSDYIQDLADYLLENGVIVPPCKVGDTLFFIYNSPYANKPDLTPRIYKTDDWYFDIDKKGISIRTRDVHGYMGKYHYYLGKTVFLTREEVETALKERKEK